MVRPQNRSMFRRRLACVSHFRKFLIGFQEATLEDWRRQKREEKKKHKSRKHRSSIMVDLKRGHEGWKNEWESEWMIKKSSQFKKQAQKTNRFDLFRIEHWRFCKNQTFVTLFVFLFLPQSFTPSAFFSFVRFLSRSSSAAHTQNHSFLWPSLSEKREAAMSILCFSTTNWANHTKDGKYTHTQKSPNTQTSTPTLARSFSPPILTFVNTPSRPWLSHNFPLLSLFPISLFVWPKDAS